MKTYAGIVRIRCNIAPPYQILQPSYKRRFVITNWMVRAYRNLAVVLQNINSSAKTACLPALQLLRLQSTSFLFCSVSLTSSLLIPLKYCSCLIIFLVSFFIFYYETETKAITEDEHGLDQQKKQLWHF
jgi:hypothetical protein